MIERVLIEMFLKSGKSSRKFNLDERYSDVCKFASLLVY